MDNQAIIQRLIEHDARFDELKADLSEFRNEILTSLDRAMVILQRLDQERVFTQETIQRMQRQIDEQQQDLNRLKQVLKIS